MIKLFLLLMFLIYTLVRKKFLPQTENAMVTNTSLAIMRLIGKYLRMTKLLHAIAEEVMLGAGQLVYYYLYTIYTTFAVR